jgi:translation initiation factor IF-3
MRHCAWLRAVKIPPVSFFRRCLLINNKDHQINEEIRDREVRVIGEAGEQLGVMSSKDALEVAANRNLDLVKIAPQAIPPVCRIMDYGKFRFEQSKKDKEARKNHRVVEIKEIRLSAVIDVHDYEFKLRNALRFLEDGDKVKVNIRFRGRQMAHTELGRQMLMKFADSCAEASTIEKLPKLEGRQMMMFLAPKPPKEVKPAKPAAKEKQAGTPEAAPAAIPEKPVEEPTISI